MDPTPHRIFRLRRSVLVGIAGFLALASIGAADAGLASPNATGPGPGATVSALPVFAWDPVAGADKYEFEIAANAGFDSSLAYISTRNTRATLRDTIANGTYYWHVRAISASGGVGPWTDTRTFEMAWTAKPSLLSPTNGGTLTYPADSFRLAWTPVPGASEYSVKLATDPALGSVVWATGPVKTSATSFTLAAPLAPGTYYWAITPLDAAGHAGTSSTTASFVWAWPTTTTTSFSDLAPAPEIVDPSFSWDAVPGAAGYEVEVNSSSDFAPGSKVCCSPLRVGSKAVTLGLSLSPLVQLDNNTYYWRVRALDASDNAGVWNLGPSFTQTFANVPPTPAPTVKNLRLRDNLGDPNLGVDPGTVGYPLTTGTPVLAWDPVPGASTYQVDVTPFEDSSCNWSHGMNEHWVDTTSTTAWSPLGSGWNNVKPFPNPTPVSTDTQTMVAGHTYCVRVRPSDRASTTTGPTTYGDWTYLPANNVAAFTWADPALPGPCSPCSLGASDYLAPATGVTAGRMPLFTWNAMAGAASYFVLVSRDPSFTNLVDYAFTRIPAYAPRTGNLARTYPDELTSYYWAVLPATAANGNGVSADPLAGTVPSFHKQSAAPTLVAPAPGAVSTGTTVFRWTTTESARRYRIQVAQDPSFANLIDDVVTDSTAYTSDTTYPADTIIYWRVRADADDGSSTVGLSWSAPGTFQKQLPFPSPDPSNPTSGAELPTLAWTPVPGAISYDVHAEEADGDERNFSNLPTHAFTPTKMTGVGIFHLQARANFATRTGAVVHGPYSSLMAFARTIPEPGGASSDVTKDHVVFSWNPRIGAKEYRMQISTRPDFNSFIENLTTEATNHAPLLLQGDYADGGKLYWRVAAVDADLNVGDFSPVQQIGIDRPLRLRILGTPIRGRNSKLTVVATSQLDQIVGVSLRIWGAGLKARTVKTKANGRVTFTVKPKKKGLIYVRGTKVGFNTANTNVPVRVVRIGHR
jgi:hypothetical protein